MNSSYPVYIILMSDNNPAGEWRIRCSTMIAEHSGNPNIAIAKATTYITKQQSLWQAAEPRTHFKIAKANMGMQEIR